MERTAPGARDRRIRVLANVVAASLLVVAAALVVVPVTAEVAGSTADCGVPAFALRAPSERDDVGFSAVEDACSGAAFGRLFIAFVLGGCAAAAFIGGQRGFRGRSAPVE